MGGQKIKLLAEIFLVYFFERNVHMRIEGAWRMASYGGEE
jgi:hypothetical protein